MSLKYKDCMNVTSDLLRELGSPKDIAGRIFMKYVTWFSHPSCHTLTVRKSAIQPTYAVNHFHCLRMTNNGTTMAGVTFTNAPSAKQNAARMGRFVSELHVPNVQSSNTSP